MTLYALPCHRCGMYCPIVERNGHLVIVCSEHGDDPLYRKTNEMYVPLTWADLTEKEEKAEAEA